MKLAVSLKSSTPEEAGHLFARFASWGDTSIPGEMQGETLYFLHAANLQDIEAWCKAAVLLNIIVDYAIYEDSSLEPTGRAQVIAGHE